MAARTPTLVVVALLSLFASAITRAQEAPILLRPDATFVALAERIAQGAARRLGREVIVGASVDESTPTQPPSVVRLETLDGRAALTIVGRSGTVYRTSLAIAEDEAATVRALVLSLAALVESAAADPGPSVAPVTTVEPTRAPREELPLLGPTDGSALRDLADPFDRVDFTPRVLVELRGRLGLGTQRDVSVAGIGLTAGACLGPYCVVLDADTLIPEEDHARRSGVVSYVFTTVGLGGRFLPLVAGPVRGGIGVSLLLRTGHLWIEELAISETTFAAGGRFSAEGALMLADPLALVLSGGLDVAFNPTRFVRATEIVFVEDVVVPWLALGLRICPN
jgi:hypothetical protein